MKRHPYESTTHFNERKRLNAITSVVATIAVTACVYVGGKWAYDTFHDANDAPPIEQAPAGTQPAPER